MESKIRKLLVRFGEVEALLGRAEVLADQKLYRSLAQEHSYLSQVKEASEALSNGQEHRGIF